MSLIIPPGYAQVVWSFVCAGDPDPMVTTCGIDHTADTALDPTDLANRMHLAMIPGIMAGMSSSYSLLGATVYIGQDGSDPVIGESDLDSVDGQGGTPVPPNVAVLIRKRTSVTGRRGRGRFYIPGIPEGNVDPAGSLTSGALSDWQDNADDLYSRINNTDSGGIPYVPVVLHRSEGIGAEPAPTPIVTFIVDPLVATQRRRLRK